MSNLTEWRWNRDWGMVKLAPHSPVAASEGFYKVTDVRDALNEAKDLQEVNEWLKGARESLIADIAELEDELRQRRSCRNFEIIERRLSHDKMLQIVDIVQDADLIRVIVVRDGD